MNTHLGNSFADHFAIAEIFRMLRWQGEPGFSPFLLRRPDGTAMHRNPTTGGMYSILSVYPSGYSPASANARGKVLSRRRIMMGSSYPSKGLGRSAPVLRTGDYRVFSY